MRRLTQPSERPGLVLLILAVALALLPMSARGQQVVTGSVVEEGSTTPVGGAMIVLLQGDRTVVQALSGTNGTYRLAVPAPGRYELRVDRIGYASTYSGVFDVPLDGTVVQNLTSRVAAVTIAGISVEGAGRCEVRPGAGGQTATVWEEARKALAAAEWTQERGLYRFAWTRFQRDLRADARTVLGEARESRAELGPRPFASVAPEVLAEAGFIHDRGDGLVYAAPDAGVLLSDDFLDTHCFTLEDRTEGGEQLIGLRFRPLPGRTLPDIEGVLWLGRQTLRLRSVEYRYVNLPWPVESHDAGGAVYFRGLPNGTWIVDEWSIRMPRLRETRSPSGELLDVEVTGYRAEGSVIEVVATAAGEVVARATGAGGVRGEVADSLGRPASGARVWIAGTDFEVTTGPDGRFTFEGVAEGIWSVGATGASLEAVGHAGVFADAEVARNAFGEVRIELPSARTVARARCAADPAGADQAVLVGRVVDGSGRPVPGAALRTVWSSGLRQEGFGEPVGADGRFTLCGVPAGVRLRTWALSDSRESPVFELAPQPPGAVAALELTLEERQAVAAAAPQTSLTGGDAETRWLAGKGFPLRGEGALLHQTRAQIFGRGLDSIHQVVTQVPRVEARPLPTGEKLFRLHASENWPQLGDASPSCPLEFFLNGSLVRANVPALTMDYTNPAWAERDLTPLNLDRWLLTRDVSAVEVHDAELLPAVVPSGCGAAFFWVYALDHDEDPDFTGSLSGRVMRLPANEPLAGVRVVVQPGGHEAVTDAFGRFELGWLPAARYRVEVAVPEWGAFGTDLMLRVGSRAEVTVEVEPPPPSPGQAGEPR